MAKTTKTTSDASQGDASQGDASQGDQGGGAGADKAGPAAPPAGEIDLARQRIRVTAAGGPRRRAGISFDTAPRTVEMRELGETAEDQQAALEKLLADPMLSVTPLIDEV